MREPNDDENCPMCGKPYDNGEICPACGDELDEIIEECRNDPIEIRIIGDDFDV
jgi:hypothetical protein